MRKTKRNEETTDLIKARRRPQLVAIVARHGLEDDAARRAVERAQRGADVLHRRHGAGRGVRVAILDRLHHAADAHPGAFGDASDSNGLDDDALRFARTEETAAALADERHQRHADRVSAWDIDDDGARWASAEREARGGAPALPGGRRRAPPGRRIEGERLFERGLHGVGVLDDDVHGARFDGAVPGAWANARAADDARSARRPLPPPPSFRRRNDRRDRAELDEQAATVGGDVRDRDHLATRRRRRRRLAHLLAAAAATRDIRELRVDERESRLALDERVAPPAARNFGLDQRRNQRALEALRDERDLQTTERANKRIREQQENWRTKEMKK